MAAVCEASLFRHPLQGSSPPPGSNLMLPPGRDGVALLHCQFLESTRCSDGSVDLFLYRGTFNYRFTLRRATRPYFQIVSGFNPYSGIARLISPNHFSLNADNLGRLPIA